MAKIDIIKRKGKLFNKSKLRQFHPLEVSDGIVRVGGKILNSNVPWDRNHPIMFDTKSHLITLNLRYKHLRHFHVGPQHILS